VVTLGYNGYLTVCWSLGRNLTDTADQKPTTGLEHFPDCSLNAGVLLGALRQTCEHVD